MHPPARAPMQISAMQKQDKMILDQKKESEERQKLGAKAPMVLEGRARVHESGRATPWRAVECAV